MLVRFVRVVETKTPVDSESEGKGYRRFERFQRCSVHSRCDWFVPVSIPGVCLYTFTDLPQRYFFVIFIPFFYIQDYGAFHNINEDLQQYLVAIMNFMGVFARVGLGLVADKLGMYVS